MPFSFQSWYFAFDVLRHIKLVRPITHLHHIAHFTPWKLHHLHPTHNFVSTMVDTAKFNVGGRHFEVSRALVDEHSDTMLGKLVSDTWNEDPGKIVFVDRSGDIFAQVLEYLRYGR